MLFLELIPLTGSEMVDILGLNGRDPNIMVCLIMLFFTTTVTYCNRAPA